MKQNFFYKIPFVLALAMVVFPSFAFASVAYTIPNIWNPTTVFANPILICSGAPQANKSTSLPICHDLCDLVDQFINIVYLAIAAVLWIIAPITFLVGGLMYMFAGANPGLESKAKKALLGAVIGVAIVLCAYIIIATFVGFLKITGVGGFGTSTCTIK